MIRVIVFISMFALLGAATTPAYAVTKKKARKIVHNQVRKASRPVRVKVVRPYNPYRHYYHSLDYEGTSFGLYPTAGGLGFYYSSSDWD